MPARSARSSTLKPSAGSMPEPGRSSGSLRERRRSRPRMWLASWASRVARPASFSRVGSRRRIPPGAEGRTSYRRIIGGSSAVHRRSARTYNGPTQSINHFKEGNAMNRRGVSWLGSILAVAVLTLAGTGPVRGAGFGLFEQGAKAMGMAGAFTAQADDPSLFFYNVGGLGLANQRQWALGGVR